jgi:signal transduction histidine kinase
LNHKSFSGETLVPHRPIGFAQFIRAVLLPLGLGLGLFYLLLRPPMEEFAVMLILMTVTALASVFAAYAAYRAGWLERSPYIRVSVMGGYAFAGLLIFLNVGFIAWQMFASPHDLLLATVLLIFASGIAMTLGYFMSAALTDRILLLGTAAQRVAQGKLNTRVAVTGRDEMAGLAAAFNEMAQQLQATEQKQRELDQLRRDLTAWVGHDLRTPLTSVRAMIEALADGMVDDPETVQRYLKTAQRDILSLSVLIDDLFEISQMDAGGLIIEREPGSLSDLISDTLESFSELAGRKSIELKGSAVADVDPVEMDVQRIGRVLSNLVSNALRHTPPGGQVDIQANSCPDGVCVAVRDSGEGIQPADLPHLFERFYRGDKSRSRSTGGAGLGLAIARGLVEAHGGSIHAESQPGQGAVFTFTLPKTTQNKP